MRDELSESLRRLSQEIEEATKPASSLDVRRRADKRRSRSVVTAAAMSVTAVAVASPFVAGAGPASGPAGPANGSETSGPATGLPSATPSPTPSLGWDTSVQRANVQLDEQMVRCVRAEGFAAFDLSATPTRSRSEQIAELGFGISTGLEGDRGVVEEPDPTAEFRKRLPAQRRSRFDDAMERCRASLSDTVTPPAVPDNRAIVVPSEDGSGTFSIMMVGSIEADYDKPVRALVEADPRIVAATAGWSDCMEASGWEAVSPDALGAQIEAMTQPYRDAYEAGLPVAERGNDGPKSRSLAEVLTAEELAGLAEVQRYERAAAVASDACDDELNMWLPVVWQDKLDEYLGYTG